MKTDLSKGSILSHVIRLSWPMMVAMLFHIGFNVVDTIFLARVSTEALAAISITFPVIFFTIAIGGGIGIGTTSLISRLLGAGKKGEAQNAALHGLLLSFFVTMMITALGLTTSQPLFRFLGAEGRILDLSMEYTRIIFGGSVFLFLAFMTNSILRGEGDMKTPMKVMIVSSLVNVILDPIMIFGLFGFPRLEVAGAAIATVAARMIASAYSVWYVFFSKKTSLQIRISAFRYRAKLFFDILHVGIPASLSQSINSLGLFFLLKIVSYFGPSAIATYGIVSKLDAVAILPVLGVSSAVITIVGFNVGAGLYDRAARAVSISCAASFLFMESIGLILFLFPDFWIGLFTPDQEIIRIGAAYLKIVAFSYGIMGIGIIIASAFQGAGKGSPSIIISVLRLFVLNIPLSYLLAITIGLGLTGIWWGIVISSIIAAAAAAAWFSLGTWKKSKVRIEEIVEPGF